MFFPCYFQLPFVLPPPDLPVAFAAEEKRGGRGMGLTALPFSLRLSSSRPLPKNSSCMPSLGWRQRLFERVGFSAYINSLVVDSEGIHGTSGTEQSGWTHQGR